MPGLKEELHRDLSVVEITSRNFYSHAKESAGHDAGCDYIVNNFLGPNWWARTCCAFQGIFGLVVRALYTRRSRSGTLHARHGWPVS
jgi:hypothetical protein